MNKSRKIEWLSLWNQARRSELALPLRVVEEIDEYLSDTWDQCCPGKVAPTDGKSLPLNVLWPVLPGNDLKSRGRKWPPERSIPTRHNGG